jgi:hypothetical protein
MVYTTKYKNIDIKIVNLETSNSTLVVAPNYNGVYLDYIIDDGMIAEQIATNPRITKQVYNMLKKQLSFNLFLSN